MKKITILLSFALGLIFVLGSCTKVEKDPVLNLSQIVPASFTAPATGSAYVLTLADSATAFQVTWDAAIYQTVEDALLPTPTYSLQWAFADSNFVGAKELVNTKELQFETIYYVLNSKLLALGVQPETTVNMELRIKSSISGTVGTDAVSDVITLTFTTFEPPTPPPADTPRLWVPGDYQGWNPGAAPNVWSPNGDGLYKGYIYFPEGGTLEFKFTSAPDWNHTNFGYASDGTLATDPSAGNLSVAEFGNYYMNVDTIALTWTNELRNFALIGTFNDWAGDAPLTWDNTNRMFTITQDFTAGTEFKWRANADWAVNFGEDGTGNNTLSQDGANIVLDQDGNYTINLYLETEKPTYEIIKN